MKEHFDRLNLTRLFLLLITVMISLVMFGSIAFAQANEPTVIVELIIEMVTTHGLRDCDYSPGAPCDFYPEVWIDGKHFKYPPIDDENTIYPNWHFYSDPIPISKRAVGIDISIWDSDPSSDPNGDDLQWLTPGDVHPNLGIDVNLVPCSLKLMWLNDAAASCDTTLESSGRTNPVSGDWATIRFQVKVQEPAYGPELRVRCLHKPVWPEPGQTVTITAEALDGQLNSRISDKIEIYVNDKTVPVKTGAGTELSATVGPFSDDSFIYNCRVVDDSIPVSTGWHRVSVGDTLANLYDGVAPIYYNGDRTASLDIVFHRDQESYPCDYPPCPSGHSFTDFLNAVYDTIENGFFNKNHPASGGMNYVKDFMLLYQHRLNFWISKNFGHVKVVVGERDCKDLRTDEPFVTWSDSKLILHTKNCDDSAAASRLVAGHIAAVTPPGGSALHEAGHALFGLADEYCPPCDGGYFQPEDRPNLYDNEGDCRGDALNVERSGDECRKFRSDSGQEWWTSDPLTPDLMGSDSRPNKLDQRRIDHIFELCESGRC